MLSLHLDLKSTFSLQYGKSLSIVHLSIVPFTYLGKLSFFLRTKLKQTIERDLPYCKLIAIFISKFRLNTLFQFKDPLEKKFALE